jgi:hypothetical protein
MRRAEASVKPVQLNVSREKRSVTLTRGRQKLVLTADLAAKLALVLMVKLDPLQVEDFSGAIAA